MQSPSLIKALSNLPAFQHADPNSLKALAERARRICLPSKQHLFHAGQAADYFYWIERGGITLYLPSYNGDEKIVQTLEQGCLLGATVMFSESGHYPLSAQASEYSVLYRLDRELLLDMTRHSPEVAYTLLQIVSNHLVQAINRIDLLTITNATQRLITYLLDIYRERGSAWITLPASHAVLARQLNMTPENLSRTLAAFRRAGLIGGRARELVLLDVDAICRQARLPPPVPKPAKREAVSAEDKALFRCCSPH
ncbi:Crp/Fnr family transcriptional regulator [Allopusillimonas ginsengisoli]|uniref:Crp/Fnr family transcriptional regulator n=1 Tax=Allopusillimonas ginsengisoli TaxID=453575 RepID=UPI00101F97B8|nr:Crp/Fnr family transcriptional regulator [Allopusillimonas ginsengisoli]TEA74122.1 Crp/Fnr family transcriptional regulator [Allopusillimonas ginsengisoli]